MNPAIMLAVLKESGHIGYCTTCRRDNMIIVNSDVVNMTTECRDCYQARMRGSTDQVQQDKEKRADQVRQYFAKRKREEV